MSIDNHRSSHLMIVLHTFYAFCIILNSNLLYARDTYYEVWRQGINDEYAQIVATWLKTNSYEDTGVNGIYFYAIRVITADTVFNEWINLNYSIKNTLTCPTATTPNAYTPIRVDVELGGGIFGPFQATLQNRIVENGSNILDDWYSGPYFISVTSDIRLI